jgi:hypothetical protein
LAIPVLVVLAVLWAAFFLWPLLSGRSSSGRRSDSIGDFSYRLGVIGKTGGHHRRRRSTPQAIPVAMPPSIPPARPLHAPVPGANGSRGPVPRAASAPVLGLPRPGMTRSQRRRRDVLLILGVGVLSTLLLAIVAGNSLFWMVQALTDVLLAGYLLLLVKMKRTESMRRAKVHYLPGPSAASALALRRTSVSS